MFTRLSVEIPTPALIQLMERLREQGGTQDLSEAISDAIHYWLGIQGPVGNDEALARGYRWKCLYLPLPS